MNVPPKGCEYIFQRDAWEFNDPEMIKLSMCYQHETTNNLCFLNLGAQQNNIFVSDSLSNIRKKHRDNLFSLAQMINIAVDELNIAVNELNIAVDEQRRISLDKIRKGQLKCWSFFLCLRTYIDICVMFLTEESIDTVGTLFKQNQNAKKWNSQLALSQNAKEFLKVVIDGSNNLKHIKNEEAQKILVISGKGLSLIPLVLHKYDKNFLPEKDNNGKIITHVCHQNLADILHGTNLFTLKIFDTLCLYQNHSQQP